MEVITGDENGILRIVNTGDSNSYLTYGDEPNRLKGIKGLVSLSDEISPNFGGDISISVLRRQGDLEIWQKSGGELFKSKAGSFESKVEDPINCFKMVGKPALITFNATGQMSSSKFESSDLGWLGKCSSTAHPFMQLGQLSAGASCSGGGLAFGGNENDLQFYDLNTQQSVWKAKNVSHDKLNLRVPIWVTSLKFLDPINDTISSGASVVVGTGHRNIRLYDSRTSQKPIVSSTVSDEFRVTIVEPRPDGRSVYFGDTSGGLYLWDIRNQKRLNTLHGFGGSVRDARLSPNGGQYLCAVGLDRFLRVYNTERNKVDKAAYLKNRLNVCLPMPESTVKRSKVAHKRKEAAKYDSDEEDILENFANSSDDDSMSGKARVVRGAESSGESSDEDEDEDDWIGQEGDSDNDSAEFSDRIGSSELEDDDDEDGEDDDKEEEEKVEDSKPAVKRGRNQALLLPTGKKAKK